MSPEWKTFTLGSRIAIMTPNLARQARPDVEELQTVFPQDIAGDQHIALAELFHTIRRDGNLPDPGLGRILDAAGIYDSPEVGPKTRGKAHRARFARCVDDRAEQVQLPQLTTGGSDSLDFAMRCGVDIRLRAVMRDSQDLPLCTIQAPNGISPFPIPSRAA